MSVIKSAARVAGKSLFAAADLLTGSMPGPRILIYHQVGARMGRQMEVTADAFANHIEWIEANGRVVGLVDALEHRSDPDAHDMFVLTFDDGYRDVYEQAWPLLRDRGLDFTLYLTTDPVESGTPLTPGGSADPLTWDQVREMHDSGLMTLGAHTHTHPDLHTAPESLILEEIERSNELIASRTGVEPRHFTYPWGYWSQTADRVVRSAYDSATLGSGEPVTAQTDPLTVNRVPVQLSDGTFFFKRKMARGMRLEDRVRRKLTGYSGP